MEGVTTARQTSSTNADPRNGFSGGVAVAIGAAAACYSTGVWLPNRVTRSQFPVQGIDVSRHQGAIAWSRVSPGEDFGQAHITNPDVTRRLQQLAESARLLRLEK
jgi:hypothetical protein